MRAGIFHVANRLPDRPDFRCVVGGHGRSSASNSSSVAASSPSHFGQSPSARMTGKLLTQDDARRTHLPPPPVTESSVIGSVRVSVLRLSGDPIGWIGRGRRYGFWECRSAARTRISRPPGFGRGILLAEPADTADRCHALLIAGKAAIRAAVVVPRTPRIVLSLG
jgi:hypothetical protein